MALAVLAAVWLATVAEAQEPATLLLRSGERLTGELVDLGGSGFTTRGRVRLSELWLTVNDGHAPDNSGSYRVMIFITQTR